MPAKHPEQDARTVRELRRQGMSWKDIGHQIGCSGTTARCLVDQDYAEMRRNDINYRRRHGPSPNSRRSVRVVDDKNLPKVPEDTRTLTGRVFGDPLPGRSAYDKLKMEKTK